MNKSRGTVKFFNSKKGFGFITPDDGSKEIFVHINNVDSNVEALNEGQTVEYIKSEGRKGPEAKEVNVI